VDDGGRRRLRSRAVALQKQIMPTHDGTNAPLQETFLDSERLKKREYH
jgi:hypothetical protein